jgi:hypothetical protein
MDPRIAAEEHHGWNERHTTIPVSKFFNTLFHPVISFISTGGATLSFHTQTPLLSTSTTCFRSTFWCTS